MNCLFHEVNVVDDNGELHYEQLKRLLPDNLKEFVQHIIDACESHVPQGGTQCDRAWSWHVCFKQTDPVVNISDFYDCYIYLKYYFFSFSITSCLKDIFFLLNLKINQTMVMVLMYKKY